MPKVYYVAESWRLYGPYDRKEAHARAKKLRQDGVKGVRVVKPK